jgi:DNA-binding winged helix-turn-helix (wHTH) protein/Tol biopolymer transport system component
MGEEIGRLGDAKKIRDPLFVSGETADRNRQEIYEFGPFLLEPAERKLLRGGEVVALTPKVFDMLVMLVRHSGHLLEKDDLIRSLWPDAFVEEGNLSNNIFVLRKALGSDHEYIETVPRRGYRFVGAVRQLPSAEKPLSEPRESEGEVPAGRGSAGLVSVFVSSAARRPRYGLLVLAGTALVIPVVIALWYLSRPLPPPRISAYVQITHDGREKRLMGTDGSRLYYTQESPNAILQIGVNGGQTVPVPMSLPGLYSGLEDISPDGSNALVTTTEAGYQGYPMWVVPILGGAATSLGYGGGESFSPDGTSVIYSSDAGDISMVRIDGTGRRTLAHVGSGTGFFSWSPDGKTIRFTKGDGKLWEMSSDGSGIHRLLPNWHEQDAQCCGRWAPDGRFYFFCERHPPKPGSEIWALDERRQLFRRRLSQPTQLTTGPMFWGRPIPSRDGKKIFANAPIQRGELSRIDPRAGGTQPFLGGISAENVAFSADGKSVVYVSYPEGILWKANRDGSNPVRLNQPPGLPLNPRWSPDSRQILFLNVAPDDHTAAYLVSADGGNAKKLLAEYDADTGDANWSPDGSRVLFDWCGVFCQADKRDLRILDLKSRKMTTIPGSTGMFASRWSPDGRYVAALATPKTPELRVFDFKTQRWDPMQTSNGVSPMVFSRDSRFLYFARGPDQAMLRIPVTGGKEEIVVDMTDWHLTGQFGGYVGLDPTEAPLVLRDTSSADIYALTLDSK